LAEDVARQHLEVLRQDARDEVKRRIEQRDKYSIQLTIALGIIVAVAFGSTRFDKVLIAAPLVSIYFTVLILYSYRIHGILARYLREQIEPELARICGTSPKMEWETFYSSLPAKPGIRRMFFLMALWVVYFLTITYLLTTEFLIDGCGNISCWNDAFRITLIIISGAYLLASGWITLLFGKD